MANTVYFEAGNKPVSDPTKPNSGGYAFENWAIDDNLLQSFAKNGAYLFSDVGSIGAQAQSAVNSVVEKVQKAIQQKMANLTAQLTSINPAFDPKYYLADISKIYDAGEGSSSNRTANVTRTQLQIIAYNTAVLKAQQAAEEYKKTGVIKPYPPSEQNVIDTFKAYNPQMYGSMTMETAKKIVAKLGGNISAEAKATANAAAARVGAPLPYPDGGIGQIAGGGVFQNAEQAQQAYTNGQLNTVGQNIVSSNSAGNMKDGVNQAIVNPDGTVSWNGQTFPSKDEAALAANASGVTSLRFGDGSTTGSVGTTTGGVTGVSGTPGVNIGATTGGTTTGVTTSPVRTIDPQAQANAMSILNKYLNDGTIDNGTYQMFKKAVELWDTNQEVDYANILNTFEQIKQTDIDPYFQQQASLFTNELEANRDYIIQSKVLEDKSLEDQKKRLKEDMQKDLAARGMLFTGESVKQLGSEGTYATEGTPEAQRAAIPTIKPFADGVFQQQTEAASSASNLRYQKTLQDLQRQAEARLGSEHASVIPGTSLIGGITGTLEGEKKQAYASSLTGLYNQEMANVGARTGQESQIFKE